MEEKEINFKFSNDFLCMSFNSNSDNAGVNIQTSTNKYPRVRFPSTTNNVNQANNFIAWNNNFTYLHKYKFNHNRNESYSLGNPITNYTRNIFTLGQ